MSDEQQQSVEENTAVTASAEASDKAADAGAILVMFVAAVAFCVFYISGWSFDL